MEKFKSLESKIRDILSGKVAESTYTDFRTAVGQVAQTTNDDAVKAHRRRLQIQSKIIDNP